MNNNNNIIKKTPSLVLLGETTEIKVLVNILKLKKIKKQ